MPANRLLPQQEHAAQQIGDINPLPASARQHAAVDWVRHDLLNAVTGMQRRFKGIERRRLADTIHAHAQGGHVATRCRVAGEDHLKRIHKSRYRRGNLVRRQPAGHLHREGDQQDHIPDHRRVKRVMPQAAVQLFGNNNRENGAQHHHPPG
ncbi:hypothetical protein D3C71_1655410 [compost metagenome]